MFIIAYAKVVSCPIYRWKKYHLGNVIIQVNSAHQEMNLSVYAVHLVVDNLDVTDNDVSIEICGSGLDFCILIQLIIPV